MNNIIKLLEVAEWLVRKELKKKISSQRDSQFLFQAECEISGAIQSLMDWEQDKVGREGR